MQRLPRQTRTFVATCIYGVVAGLAAVMFHLTISAIYSVTYEQYAKGDPVSFIIKSFFTVTITAGIAGWLLTRFCPDATGSGIPQLKLAFWKDFGYVPLRVAWVKFLAGAISIGGGSSLGREGPSVQIAGALASNTAGLLGEPKQNRRNASAAGAAAGLAAAFNTPLAAITFVLEEIVGDLNSRFLGSVLLASVLGAFVAHAIVGEEPAFTLSQLDPGNWVVYLLIPLVAAFCSFLGVIFQKWTMRFRKQQKQIDSVPLWVKPIIGAIITWVVGVLVFMQTGSAGVFGIGYQTLSESLANHVTWQNAGILVLGKLIATVACYSWAGCGGIFSPTLFIGAVGGIFISGLMGQFVQLDPGQHTLLAVVGMSSCLGAVVRTPVTGILIVFEMTHDFSVVPALMLGALISQAVSRRLSIHNFYDELLVQDGHNLQHVIPPRDLRSWQQLPVSAVMNFEPVVIRDLTPESMKQAIEAHPYNYFPVMVDKELRGILSRQKAQAAIESGKEPILQKAATCLPSDHVRQLQFKLIESPTGVAIMLDRPNGQIIGIITLHDLLRAEVGMTKDHEG
jgi:chloride channel protein, CIC family